MKRIKFPTELSYVLGLVIMAFGAAFCAKADLGMSMVVAPAYILHLKVSELFPWFTFGVAEYVLQGGLVLLCIVIMRRLKLNYLFSFLTAFIYGNCLDGAGLVISSLPSEELWLRLIWYVLGTLLCSLAVSLFFHTYLAPEAYELLVKEISSKTGWNISKVKTVYDCTSLAVSVIMSFVFFGFGVFEGVKWGTVLCAVINGALISCFTRILERIFRFENTLKLEKYFK